MKHIYSTFTHADKGAFPPGFLFGAHDDKASSTASRLTSGREATSKKTLKEPPSRSAPRTRRRARAATRGERLAARDLLVRVLVSDGLEFVVRRGGEHVVELPDDGRQVGELVARVELQDGSLRDGWWRQVGEL